MTNDDVNVRLNPFQQRMVVQGMVDMRNRLIENDKPTEDVDEILMTVIDAPKVKKRREERGTR